MNARESYGAASAALLDWEDDLYTETPSMPSPRGVVREVAHMMRSPLGSIVLMAETLRERAGSLSEDESRRMLSIIHNAAAGLLMNAGDLLGLAGEPEAAPSLQPYSALESLTSVADVVRPVAEVRGCTLTVRAPDGLALSGPGLTVRRVMLAIALRVVRRSSDSRVTIGATSLDDGSVEFFVEGSGQGMRPEGRLDELLDVFRPDGTGDGGFTLSSEGLSLETASELVRGMGSELHMDGDSPSSLRVRFRVPATMK